ncbi:MAG: hypothetical protein L6R45_11620 [Anaerolineae bacterium]|nr:hypothetical protein [Anaerolineae bacterium]
MTDFLGSASPDQLLIFMAVPVLGAVICAAVLFAAFAGRMRKGLTKTESLAPSSLPLAAPTTLSFAPPPQTVTQPVVASQAPAPEVLPDDSVNTAELDLNLNLLNQPVEMEVEMINPSKSTRENRTGLSARLGQQTRPAALPSLPAVSQPSPVPANPPATRVNPPISPAEPVELLRLLRDPQTGQLMVEIAGRRYTRLAEIADKKVGHYILTLAAHLLAFTNGMVATEAGLKALPAPKVGAVPMPLATPGPTTPPLAAPTPPASASPGFVPPPPPEVEAAFLASLRAQPTKPEPPQPQRRGLFNRAKPAPEETLLPTLNLAEQINTIAQTRLRYSPLAATIKLEITSDPGGGILINVNGAFYHGPDDIPQPEVKELIKASIQEWEKS